MQIDFKIDKGIDLNLIGSPSKEITDETRKIFSVGILGKDYPGLAPFFLVKEGDRVITGQPLFNDKKNNGIVFTSPSSGKVSAINRGKKRKFLSIVISLDTEEKKKKFKSYENFDLLNKEEVKKNLLDSGLWTSIRTRPYNKVANPEETPSAIFINAMDSDPLAPCVETIINLKSDFFEKGLKTIATLSEKVHLCKTPNCDIPHGPAEKIMHHTFSGKHPSGLVGTHIHYIHPVNEKQKVWHLNYQDVIAIGELFISGELPTEKIIAFAGEQVKNPRLIKIKNGANLEQLITEQLKDGENRVISGSIFNGHKSESMLNYLGRYDSIVSVIGEDRKRVFNGFLLPGADKFSIKNIFVSKIFEKLFQDKKYSVATSTHGSERDMVPIGSYEEVFPLRMQPTFLLRALLAKDIDSALELGALELSEEDVAVCSFVCPGKKDYGVLLREILTSLEKEL